MDLTLASLLACAEGMCVIGDLGLGKLKGKRGQGVSVKRTPDSTPAQVCVFSQ